MSGEGDPGPSGDGERGESQQPKYLVKALKKIGSAIGCHEAGMMDPALSDAETAMGHLEDYRRGPLLKRDEIQHEGDDE